MSAGNEDKPKKGGGNGRRRTRTVTDEEVPLDAAKFESIRVALADVRDDPEAWLETARKLRVDSLQLYKRTKRFPRGSTIAEVDSGVAGIEDWASSMRGPGRYVVRAKIRGPNSPEGVLSIVSSCEFDVPGNDPDDAPLYVPPSGGEDVDTNRILQDLHKSTIIEALRGRRGGSELETLKIAAELMRPHDSGLKDLVGPLLQANANLMQTIANRKEEPGIFAGLFAALAPALPDLATAAFERLTGGSGVVISDAAELGKLGWMDWLKVQIPNVVQTYPHLVPTLIGALGKLAGVEQPAAITAGVPPAKGGPAMPASERMPADVLALLSQAIEYFRGADFDPATGYLMLVDVVRCAGGSVNRDQDGNDVDGILAPLPASYLSAKLRLIDNRLGDPAVVANIKRVGEWDRQQVEPEVPAEEPSTARPMPAGEGV